MAAAAPTGCFKCGRPGHWSATAHPRPPRRPGRQPQARQLPLRLQLTPDLLQPGRGGGAEEEEEGAGHAAQAHALRRRHLVRGSALLSALSRSFQGLTAPPPPLLAGAPPPPLLAGAPPPDPRRPWPRAAAALGSAPPLPGSATATPCDLEPVLEPSEPPSSAAEPSEPPSAASGLGSTRGGSGARRVRVRVWISTRAEVRVGFGFTVRVSGAGPLTPHPTRTRPVAIPKYITIPKYFEQDAVQSVEPSPTTGTLSMAAIMNKNTHLDILPSPRDKSVGSAHEDGGSREFEFKPHLNSSSQSAGPAINDLKHHDTNMPNHSLNHASSSSNLMTENKSICSQESTRTAPNQPAAVVGSSDMPAEVGTSELHQMNSSDNAAQETQSENVNDKSAEDGYNWRKYGQKHVKGSENPRSYYKCTHPNCEVKKLLERSLDGQITEVVYKGRHNHPKPQPNRRLAGGAVPSSQGEERYDGVTNAEDKPSHVLTNLCNSVHSTGMVEPATGPASDDDIDAGGGRPYPVDDANEDDDLDSKRRKMESAGIDAALIGKPNREPRVVVQTVSEVDILDDGYRWRKYGQKVVKGNPNPRSYYKCTNAGCPVRKHVERASHDPKSVITTYEGKHNHEVPASRNTNHEMSTAPMKNVVHPINSSMPGLSGMMRACEARTFTNQYSQATESDTISLDLGVGISPNHSDATNQMQTSVPEPMQYQMQHMAPVYGNMGLPAMPVPTVASNAASSIYGSREEKGGEGFTFKATPMDRSANLCYSSTGNLVLGP